jgi:hypothetical protein
MKTPALNRWLAVIPLLLLLVESAHAFYNPEIGRWVNRDPLGEEGGVNLYVFINNNPTTDMDAFGLLKAQLQVNMQPADNWDPTRCENPPCPQFKSQWDSEAEKALKKLPPYPGKLPAGCTGIRTQCLTNCKVEFGPDMDAPEDVQIACFNQCIRDCHAKWALCLGKKK